MPEKKKIKVKVKKRRLKVKKILVTLYHNGLRKFGAGCFEQPHHIL